MKKRIILAVFCTLLSLSLVGCKSEKLQSFRYEANEITAIEIETGAASVSVLKNTGNSIEVSYTRDITSIQDGVLKINVPMPNAGIHIKAPADLIVSVPAKIFDTIQIQSEFGNIHVSELTTGTLTIKTEYGNITVLGLKGNVEAKADMGTIQTDLTIGSEIEEIDSVGQKLNAQIGTSDSIIHLYTNTGTIELK